MATEEEDEGQLIPPPSPLFHIANKNNYNCQCNITFKWLRTKLGLLKLIQLLVLMITLVTISLARGASDHRTTIEVFWIVHVVTVAFVITCVIANSTVVDKLPRILRAPATKIALCSIAYIALIGSSAWLISKFHGHCIVVLAGLFGLLAGFLFVIEDMFYVISYARHSAWTEAELVYQHMVDEPTG